MDAREPMAGRGGGAGANEGAGPRARTRPRARSRPPRLRSSRLSRLPGDEGRGGPAQRAAGEALRGEGGGGGGVGGGAGRGGGERAARVRARAPSRPRRRSAPAGCVARRARAFRRCAPGRC